MPATIYSPPDEIGDPPPFEGGDGRAGWDKQLEAEQAWTERLKEWCRERGQGELAGAEWRYPRGDGYALYIVFTERPLALIHVATGDAWEIDDITRRGLRLADVRTYQKQAQARAAIFGNVPPVQFNEGE